MHDFGDCRADQVLSAEERVGELALMLSGNASDVAARANAKSLLDKGVEIYN